MENLVKGSLSKQFISVLFAEKKKKKNVAVTVIVITVSVVLVAFGCIYLVWKYRKRVKGKEIV